MMKIIDTENSSQISIENSLPQFTKIKADINLQDINSLLNQSIELRITANSQRIYEKYEIDEDYYSSLIETLHENFEDNQELIEFFRQKEYLPIQAIGKYETTNTPFSSLSFYQLLQLRSTKDIFNWLHKNGSLYDFNQRFFTLSQLVADIVNMKTVFFLIDAIYYRNSSTLKQVVLKPVVEAFGNNKKIEAFLCEGNFANGFLDNYASLTSGYVLTIGNKVITGTYMSKKPSEQEFLECLTIGLGNSLSLAVRDETVFNVVPQSSSENYSLPVRLTPAIYCFTLKSFFYLLLLTLLVAEDKRPCENPSCKHPFTPESGKQKYCPICRDNYVAQGEYKRKLRLAKKDVINNGKAIEEAAKANNVNPDRLRKIISGESVI